MPVIERVCPLRIDGSTRALPAVRLDRASIYPDPDGLARHIYWRYRRGMRQTKLQTAARKQRV